MKFLFVFLSLFLTIVKSQYYPLNPVTYYVSNYGSDTGSCGSNTAQTCLTIGGAINSYSNAYQYKYYVVAPLIVQLGSQYKYNGGSTPPVTLDGINITINGASDGTSYLYNPQGYYSLFNITSISRSTVVSFNNLNYGTSYYSVQSYSAVAPSLLSLTPGYYSSYPNSISINFNNFVYSCFGSYTNLLQIVGTNSYIYNGPSEDYNSYISSLSAYTPALSINLNNFTLAPSTYTYSFYTPMINVTYLPVQLTITNSNLTGSMGLSDSLIVLGRGQLKVKDSLFNLTLNNYDSNVFVFDTFNVEADFKNNTINFQEGSNNGFFTCSGCFFHGNLLNVSSNSYSSYYSIFNFENSATTIINSLFYAPSQVIINSQSSQLSLRTNKFYTTYSNAIKIDDVSLFLFYNSFYTPSSYNNNYYIYQSYSPIITCSTSSLSTLNGDENSLSTYTSECNSYEHTAKVRWAFLFVAVGVVGILVVFAFLKISAAIIRRCGGGDESVSYSYNRINR